MGTQARDESMDDHLLSSAHMEVSLAPQPRKLPRPTVLSRETAQNRPQRQSSKCREADWRMTGKNGLKKFTAEG